MCFEINTKLKNRFLKHDINNELSLDLCIPLAIRVYCCSLGTWILEILPWKNYGIITCTQY